MVSSKDSRRVAAGSREKGNLRRDHIPCAVLLGGQRKLPAREWEGLISHTLPEMPTFFVRLDMLTGGRDHWC